MEPTGIEGSWNVEKEKLKQRFARLTNNDLLHGGNRNEKIFLQLQAKLGISKDELNTLLFNL